MSAIIASMNIIFYKEKMQTHGLAWAYALYKLNEKGVLLYYKKLTLWFSLIFLSGYPDLMI